MTRVASQLSPNIVACSSLATNSQCGPTAIITFHVRGVLIFNAAPPQKRYYRDVWGGLMRRRLLFLYVEDILFCFNFRSGTCVWNMKMLHLKLFHLSRRYLGCFFFLTPHMCAGDEHSTNARESLDICERHVIRSANLNLISHFDGGYNVCG